MLWPTQKLGGLPPSFLRNKKQSSIHLRSPCLNDIIAITSLHKVFSYGLSSTLFLRVSLSLTLFFSCPLRQWKVFIHVSYATACNSYAVVCLHLRLLLLYFISATIICLLLQVSYPDGNLNNRNITYKTTCPTFILTLHKNSMQKAGRVRKKIKHLPLRSYMCIRAS